MSNITIKTAYLEITLSENNDLIFIEDGYGKVSFDITDIKNVIKALQKLNKRI